MSAGERVIPRNRKEFAELRKASLGCVVVQRENGWREVEQPVERAWDLLDRDPKARLLDLGDGTYKVERRRWPLWFLLRKVEE